MKKTMSGLLLLLVLVAATSAAAEDITLILDPPALNVPPASSQVFNASFSDGSQVKQCVWATTGNPPNTMVSLGNNNAVAVFGAGTAPGQYVGVQQYSRRDRDRQRTCHRSTTMTRIQGSGNQGRPLVAAI